MLTSLKNAIAPSDNDGHAVVLLHAFPLSADMWRFQIDALEEAGVAAIAPNAYGIEGSEGKKVWGFEEYAHELATLLDTYGCMKAAVAGLSMGGYQAFALYRLFPQRIHSLVLCDTRAEADDPEAVRSREAFIEAVEKNGATEAASRMMPNYFTPQTRKSNPSLVQQAERMIIRQSPETITSAMRAIMNRTDSTAMLKTISCPVLVLNGSEDCLTTAETARSIAESVSGAALQLIPGAAHLANMEQPKLFSRALLDHLGKTAYPCR